MVNNFTEKPLFDLSIARQCVSNGQWELVTDRAKTKVKELQWTSQHVVELFDLLESAGTFRKVMPGMESCYGPLDCDDYVIKLVEVFLEDDFDPNEPGAKLLGVPKRHEPYGEFYVKFSLDQMLDPAVCIVSIHLSGAP